MVLRAAACYNGLFQEGTGRLFVPTYFCQKAKEVERGCRPAVIAKLPQDVQGFLGSALHRRIIALAKGEGGSDGEAFSLRQSQLFTARQGKEPLNPRTPFR